MNQQTIAQSVRLEGCGLHTGQLSAVTLSPAPAGTGVVFEYRGRRIAADIDHCEPTVRQACLSDAGARILTPEHLLSAAFGAGVDNLTVTLTGGNELPAFDGSADRYYRALVDAGLVEQPMPRVVRSLVHEVTFSEPAGNVRIVAKPGDGFRVVYHLELPDRSEDAIFHAEAGQYGVEIAPARTFCLLSELLTLHDRGLVRGANARVGFVIKDAAGSANLLEIQRRFGSDASGGPLPDIPEGTRFPNEAARHKLLDFLGDLSLLGTRIRADIEIWRGGHTANHAFVRFLRSHFSGNRSSTGE